jgi:hypothetical protein
MPAETFVKAAKIRMSFPQIHSIPLVSVGKLASSSIRCDTISRTERNVIRVHTLNAMRLLVDTDGGCRTEHQAFPSL